MYRTYSGDKSKQPVNVLDYVDVRAAAVAAFAAGRTLFVPAGTHAFTGAPIDPAGQPIFIEGEPGATITIPAGQYFIETASTTPRTNVQNIRFSGGAGVYKSTFTGIVTGANVHTWRNVDFRNYTVCAWSSDSDDWPNLRFDYCQFLGASYDNTIGLALPARAAGSQINGCMFLLNRIDLKIQHGAPNVHIHSCEFIRQAGTVSSTRMRVWIVPTAYGTAGAGLTLRDSKFGVENQVAGDLQIVYANELTGTFNGNRLPDLTTAATGKVTWHTYVNNNLTFGWESSGSSPVIFSTTPNIEHLVVEPNVYGGLAPTALVQYLGSLGKTDVPVPRQRITVGANGQPGSVVTAVKATDTALTVSSTTLATDPHLQVLVQSGVLYRIEGQIIYDSATTADLTVGTSQPNGSTLHWHLDGLAASTTAVQGSVNRSSRVAGDTTNAGGVGVGTNVVAMVRGYLTPGSNGTFTLRFAQAVADPAVTTIRAGSRLILIPVG